MNQIFLDSAPDGAVVTPLIAARAGAVHEALTRLPQSARSFLEAVGFTGKAGDVVVAPGPGGRVRAVVLGVGQHGDPAAFGAVPFAAPPGVYRIDRFGGVTANEAALAWAKGAYQFDRYKAASRQPCQLIWPRGCDRDEVSRLANAITLTRDLINTPANDMGPEQLEAAVREVASAHKADVRVTTGDDLIERSFPLIHAVGRAAEQAPRLIEFEWGPKRAPRIAIVGKGVCYDTGGLNIKPGDYMKLMKKDMGGAAHALALAQLVMEAGLKCRLHVLIPAVENSISDEAFRQGDVISSRKGLTVEIGHTDAEGRLILADAVTRACEDKPELLIDFATLTGAARVALGPRIAPYFTNAEGVAEDLDLAAGRADDPVWRLPLFPGYRGDINSAIADIQNVGDGGFAGSIAAALFIERFVDGPEWLHFDIFAWNPKPRLDGPRGGEAQGLRAAYGLLTKRLALPS